MGGVEGFHVTGIYSVMGRPYILDNSVVQKYGLENKTDFAGLKNIIGGEINEYTKLDPTLPRVSNIKCPNDNCEDETEVIYVRYDDINMKFVYICSECDTIWTLDNVK